MEESRRLPNEIDRQRANEIDRWRRVVVVHRPSTTLINYHQQVVLLLLLFGEFIVGTNSDHRAWHVCHILPGREIYIQINNSILTINLEKRILNKIEIDQILSVKNWCFLFRF